MYVYPPGQPLGRRFTAAFDGTLVVSAGHIHPNGRDIVVANLGPSDKPCGDLDRDGWPGITLYRSTKFDRTPAAQPFSEDFQMGVTKPGFRAPLRAGDRITQWALYMNEDYATYQAMGYVGLFIDRAEAPAPRGGEGCTLANTAPRLLDEPLGDPTQSVMNRPWEGEPLPLCGPGLGPGCEGPEAAEPPGMEARQVHIAGFLYVPGDMGLGGELGAPPRVAQGTRLRFVNEDVGMVVRHTVTSCAWPCNGAYWANYPNGDGRFHSGFIGNLDSLNGGLRMPDMLPYWDAPATLALGKYAYYCQTHPWMRGAFEVV